MTEVLPVEAPDISPESLTGAAELPLDGELIDIYKQKFHAVEPPSEYQMPQDYQYAGRTLSVNDPDSPYNSEDLQYEFVNQLTLNACDHTWWVSAANSLHNNAANPADAEHVTLAAKHTVEVVYRGQHTGQQYEVYELGTPQVASDPEAAQAVFDSLELIDQFTGGALAADPQLPGIVLVNDIRFRNNPSGREEILGIATDDKIVINVGGVKAKAGSMGVDYRELLAATTVHELLGHELESHVHGLTGRYFPQHFKYSHERQEGEIFTDVHRRIEAKDPDRSASQPVREYGQVSPEEDFATSVDSMVSHAMGWDETTTDHLPNWKSQPDEYRSELVLGLMDEAARRAHERYGSANPGVVGGELDFERNDVGEIVAAVPARRLEVLTVDGATAIRQEIDANVRRQIPTGVFEIYNDNIV